MIKTLGKKQKNGVIVKVKKDSFNYYNGQTDANLKPLFKNNGSKIKTVKVYEPVEIANNTISVKVYPNGDVDIKPNK